MKTLKWLLLAGLAMMMTTAQAQMVYRWLDRDGKVQYSDTPPPLDARSSQQKRLGSGITVDDDGVPYAVKLAKEKNPVIAYLTDCGELCSNARALLSKRGIPFAVRDPGKDSDAADALKKQIGVLEVPAMTVGQSVVRGFDEAQWNSALDAGGYPCVNPFSKPSKPSEPAASEPIKAAPAAPPAQSNSSPAPKY